MGLKSSEGINRKRRGHAKATCDCPVYTGRRFDTETGLYYYRARYYDSSLRRFLQPDPIGYIAGLNVYTYVHNSPTNLNDPTGELAQYVIAAIVAGATVYFVLGFPEAVDEESHSTRDMVITGGVMASPWPIVKGVGAAWRFGRTLKPNQKANHENRCAQYYPESNAPATQRRFPQTKHGDPLPDVSVPHSQIGRNRSGEGSAIEWMYNENGKLLPTRRIDFSDHGTPHIHPYPHQHTLTPNNPRTAPKGGLVPGKAKPLMIP